MPGRLDLLTRAAFPYLVLAVLAFVKRHDLLAGVFVGLASVFRQRAGVVMAAFSLGLFLEAVPRAFRRHALLWIGFAGPWAVAAGVLALLGHLGPFYEW